MEMEVPHDAEMEVEEYVIDYSEEDAIIPDAAAVTAAEAAEDGPTNDTEMAGARAETEDDALVDEDVLLAAAVDDDGAEADMQAIADEVVSYVAEVEMDDAPLEDLPAEEEIVESVESVEEQADTAATDVGSTGTAATVADDGPPVPTITLAEPTDIAPSSFSLHESPAPSTLPTVIEGSNGAAISHGNVERVIEILERNGVHLGSNDGERQNEEGVENDLVALDQHLQSNGTSTEFTTINPSTHASPSQPTSSSHVCTCSIAPSLLPRLDSSSLSSIQASTSSIVPSVALTYNGQVYDLFCNAVTADSRALLFSEGDETSLFSDNAHSLMVALRERFAELGESTEEVVLVLPALGISLHEDNVYARCVSLYDFYRIHLGCGLVGQLTITVESHHRFVTGFHALVQHVQSQLQVKEDSVKEGTKTNDLLPTDEIRSEAIGNIIDIAASLDESTSTTAVVFPEEEDNDVEYGDTSEFDFDETVGLEEGQEPTTTEHVHGIGEAGEDEAGFSAIEDGQWLEEMIEAEEDDAEVGDADFDFDQEALLQEAALPELDGDDLVAVVDATIDDLQAAASDPEEVVIEEVEAVELEEADSGAIVNGSQSVMEDADVLDVAVVPVEGVQVHASELTAESESEVVESEESTVPVTDPVADALPDENEVIIDYDEVFDVSSLPSPALRPTPIDARLALDSILTLSEPEDVSPSGSVEGLTTKRRLEDSRDDGIVGSSALSDADSSSPNGVAKKARIEIET